MRGAPGAIRTRDLELRRFLLYPAELQGPISIITRPPHHGKPRGDLSTCGTSRGRFRTWLHTITVSRCRDASYAVFSDRLYFQVDYRYSGERVDGGGHRPLPFPPEQVCRWCSKAALPRPLITTLSRKRGVRICYKWPYSA